MGQPNDSEKRQNQQLRRGGEPARWASAGIMAGLVAFGFIQAWAGRNIMNPDGIQYIEVGSNYLRGHWSQAINGYWSPLYSWVVGLILYLAQPTPFHEFAVVHLVNFGLYLFSLLSFRFLLKELIRYQEEIAVTNGGAGPSTWVWEVFGYSLFLSSALNLITLSAVTPDMGVSAFVYLTAGLLMKFRRGQVGWASSAALGLILGLGYLVKSVMFVFAGIVILVAFALVRQQRIPLFRLLPLPLLFLIVASPFVGALSKQKGRLTIGDTGRVAYISNVNNLPSGYLHGAPSNSHLVFKHPPRRIHERPAAYEFGTVMPGSIPAWYDASYWYDGATFYFVPKYEVRTLVKNIYRCGDILFVRQGALLTGILVLLLYSGPPRKWIKDLAPLWSVVTPAILVLGLYFIVLIQDRYVAPFLVLIWGALFFGFRMEASPDNARVKQAVLLATACALLATVALRVARDTAKGVPDRSDPDSLNWSLKDQQVATELNKAGIQEGATVAFIGNSLFAYWAHMAKVRIAAEVPEEDVDSYYSADDATRESVMGAFAGAGAKAVVSDRLPPESESKEWLPLGSSGYYLHELR